MKIARCVLAGRTVGAQALDRRRAAEKALFAPFELMKKLDDDVRRLLTSSAVYGLGTVTIKGLSVLMLPLYTRWLTPTDYGIASIASTVSSVLGIVLTLGLNAAVTRIYYTTRNDEDRKAQNGTIAAAILAFGVLLVLALELAGPTLTPVVFEGLQYDPYIRIAVWTAFLASFGILPPIFFQLQHQPTRYVALALCSTLLTIVLTLWLVGMERRGAYGYLLANLIAMLLMVLPCVWITWKSIRPVVRWSVLASSLSFGLPLVPHNLSAWAMDLSDRVILQRHVPLSEVGLYSLGYQFGLVMLMIASSINTAWIPFLYQKMADEGDASKAYVSRLITYYVLALCTIAVAGALIAREVIALIIAPAFHESAQYVPWIVMAYLCSGLYTIPGNFLNALGHSKIMAGITLAAALVNVALNLWLIPRFGALAACWSTLAAYFLMLVLYFLVALRVYSFPYEYRRISIVLALATAVLAIGSFVDTSSSWANIALKLALVALLPAGFFHRAAIFRRAFRSRWNPISRGPSREPEP